MVTYHLWMTHLSPNIPDADFSTTSFLKGVVGGVSGFRGCLLFIMSGWRTLRWIICTHSYFLINCWHLSIWLSGGLRRCCYLWFFFFHRHVPLNVLLLSTTIDCFLLAFNYFYSCNVWKIINFCINKEGIFAYIILVLVVMICLIGNCVISSLDY